MRPRSLHLSGFTAFRNPTDLDFDGVDLFALTGPTGSGKSSLIDAICFALYGAVPRLSGVAPVVSLGKTEARVRLVFDVEGATYTVSRLVVRQGSGATQRDVRLEGPGTTVAGVKEVDARIEALLGLRFEHFTRCVVLPQGRFAAFLEDGPAARERLLKQLLDLGVYEQMRKLAGTHAGRLEGERGALDAQLHDLLVDAETVAATERRLVALEAFRLRVIEVQTELEAVETALAESEARRKVIGEDLGRLAEVAAPEDVRSLAETIAAAREVSERAVASLAEADRRRERVTAERAGLGELAALDRTIELHAAVADLRSRVERGSDAVEESAARRAQAVEGLVAAAEAHETASTTRRSLERSHAAHVVRQCLANGDECPVCLQTVEEVPSVGVPAALDDALAAEAGARAARDEAQRELAETEAALATQRALLDQRREELAAKEAQAAGAPSLETARADRERATTLDREIEEIGRIMAAAHTEAAEAAERLRACEQEAQRAAGVLDRTRDALAGLGPPVPERHDLASDWDALIAWRDETRRALEEEDRTLEADIADRRRASTGRLAELAEEAAALELAEEGDTDLRDRVVTAVASTETQLARERKDLARREELSARRRRVDTDLGRYQETEKYLRSNRFQQWLIEEAMVGLVEFANVQLEELAAGAYSLAFDAGEFEVIDHRNADARRSVKTLSGGETFLVSLALSLALAERVVATSAVGTARIESIFLDEGFGTLDAETLDTVASVVQELGSRDRMVGLVTHVRELADQIPVRFEVRRLPDGATVSRVET